MKAIVLNLNGHLEEMAVRQVRILSALTLAMFAVSLLGSGCGKPDSGHLSTGTQHIATQRFQIDPTKEAVIQGAQGSIFAIPASAFLDSMGNTVTTPVTVRLKEANRDVDILVGGLVTQAGQDMLASGGMYMIEAFSQGKALKLNPAVGIYAYLPTTQKDAAMGLYKGDFQESKLDWKLTGQREETIPECDRDKASRAKCKKCDRLTKMVKKIKPGKKPDENTDYWAERHYWENGKLFFYSSGSKKQVLSQDQIEECQSYLRTTEKGRELLTIVDQYKEEWKDRIGDYYAYKLDALGWYNIDKVVKEELVTFTGRVVDENGNPIPGAQVHMYCKDVDLKVHASTPAADGSYTLKFAKNRSFMLYAYEQGRLGKQKVTLNSDGQSMGDISLVQVDPEQAEGFLDEVM